MGAAKDLLSNASKLYTAISSGQAPAHVGKAVFARDLEICKMAGARNLADVFGHKEMSDAIAVAPSLNFGSKASTGMLPEETRLRLFGLKKSVSNVIIISQWTYKTAHPTVEQIKALQCFKDLEPVLKAFDMTDFSTFIDRVNTRFYFEEYEVPMLLADMFDLLPMASSSESVQGILGRLFGRLETDAATYGEQSNTQSNYNIDAKDNVVHVAITQDLNSDAAPAIIDKLRKEVLFGIARSEERSLLDGDTTGTHMDADVTASTDFRKAYKGLRKLALANSANGSVYDHNGDTLSKNVFDQLLSKMGKFGLDKADLCWVLGPTSDTKLVSGAVPEVFTAYALGQAASNITGKPAPLYGVQPVASEWIREDLASTGVYTTSGLTTTYALLVKKSRFMRHLRAATRVWAAPSLPSSDRMLMTGKKRHTFSGVPQTSTEKSVTIAINIETVG